MTSLAAKRTHLLTFEFAPMKETQEKQQPMQSPCSKLALLLELP
jgi:hypothetical protein